MGNVYIDNNCKVLNQKVKKSKQSKSDNSSFYCLLLNVVDALGEGISVKNLNKVRNDIVHVNNVYNSEIFELLSDSLGALDNLKTTMRVSYSTKKLLDKHKEKDESYDNIIYKITSRLEKIEQLLNDIEKIESKSKNNTNNILIESSEYKRERGLFDFLDFKIIYTYNNPQLDGLFVFDEIDKNFQYNINIEKIHSNGKKIEEKDAYKMFYLAIKSEDILENKFNDIVKKEKEMVIIGEMLIYFLILNELIKKHFRVKIKINPKTIDEPKYWEYVFEKLNIGENIKKMDINDKVVQIDTLMKQAKLDKMRN